MTVAGIFGLYNQNRIMSNFIAGFSSFSTVENHLDIEKWGIELRVGIVVYIAVALTLYIA